MPDLNVLTLPDMAAALLEVSGAVTFEDFAQGSLRFLRCAFPFHGAEIYLGPDKDRPGTFAYLVAEVAEKPPTAFPPHSTPSDFEELRLCFEANPGIEVYRGQDFTGLKGWQDLLGMAFWNDRGFDGCVHAYRAFSEVPFSETEAAIVQQAYAFFAGALNRIHLMNDERARRANLEDSLLDIPIATILLRWDLAVEQSNRAAGRLCMAWRLGAESLRMMKIPELIEVPDELLSVCEQMKEAWMAQKPGSQKEVNRVVLHPSNQTLEAKITLLRPNAVRLGAPSFLVQITEVLRRGGDSRANNEHLMARLTPAERALAQLLAGGLTNKEIATQAGKSLQTVKNQMSSILAKLGLPNRATLIAVIRD